MPSVDGNDERAFAEFYDREYASVLTFARVMVGGWGPAQEVVQEAFLSAWERWHTIDNPAGWVRTVVANRSRSWWRRVRIERQSMARSNEEFSTIETTPGWDCAEQLWTDVRSILSLRQTQVVVLTYIDDLDGPEIADLLGCSESTVRVHLNRARKKLQSKMGDLL